MTITKLEDVGSPQSNNHLEAVGFIYRCLFVSVGTIAVLLVLYGSLTGYLTDDLTVSIESAERVVLFGFIVLLILVLLFGLVWAVTGLRPKDVCPASKSEEKKVLDVLMRDCDSYYQETKDRISAMGRSLTSAEAHFILYHDKQRRHSKVQSALYRR